MSKFTAEFSHRLTAACLVFCHIIGWFFIIGRGDPMLLKDWQNSVCWPNFEDCQILLKWMGPYADTWAQCSLFLTILIFVSLWNKNIGAKGLRVLVLIALVLHLAFLAMDYRMKMNQHLMHFTLDIAFIIFTHPISVIRILLVAFYFWAGLLKYHPDWISGLALYSDPLWIPKTWQPLAAKYVLGLEIFFIWALLSQKVWLRLFVFIQLFVFHFVSWNIVGFYYPLLMYGLLFILIIHDHQFSKLTFTWKPAIISAFILFSVFQIYPKVISSEPAMTGQGRAFALHMFDALIECKPLIFPDDSAPPIRVDTFGSPRLRCDPIVFYMQIRNYCRQHRTIPKVRASLQARRASESVWHQIVDLRDACIRTDQDVSLWRNDWVQEPQR